MYKSGLTYGKLVAMTQDVLVPSRVFEVATVVLSPVIIGKYAFVPGIQNVPCVNRHIPTTRTFFSTVAGNFSELMYRFGVTWRSSYSAICSHFAGEMITIVPLKPEEVYPVLRMIQFVPMNRYDIKKDSFAAGEPTNTMLPASENWNDGYVYYENPAVVEHKFSELPLWKDFVRHCRVDYDFDKFMAFYATRLAKYDVQDTDSFYVPHHIHKEGIDTFAYKLSLAFRLIIPSDFPMMLQDPEAMGMHRSIFTVSECFIVSSAKTSAAISSYRLHQSILDLKRHLGWILPACLDWSRLNMTIGSLLLDNWNNSEWPLISVAGDFIFPPLLIPCESAFWPFAIRWSRPYRKALTGTTRVKRGSSNTKVGTYNVESKEEKKIPVRPGKRNKAMKPPNTTSEAIKQKKNRMLDKRKENKDEPPSEGVG
jgi:hypothetical protein